MTDSFEDLDGATALRLHRVVALYRALSEQLWEGLEEGGLTGNRFDYLDRRDLSSWLPRWLTREGRDLVGKVVALDEGPIPRELGPYGLAASVRDAEPALRGGLGAELARVTSPSAQSIVSQVSEARLYEIDLGPALLELAAVGDRVLSDLRLLRARQVPPETPGALKVDPVDYARALPCGPASAVWERGEQDLRDIVAEAGDDWDSLVERIETDWPFLSFVHRAAAARLATEPLWVRRDDLHRVLADSDSRRESGHLAVRVERALRTAGLRGGPPPLVDIEALPEWVRTVLVLGLVAIVFVAVTGGAMLAFKLLGVDGY